MPAITSRGASAASASRRTRSDSVTVPRPVVSRPFSSVPGRKFIDGEPMNPATNRFAGFS